MTRAQLELTADEQKKLVQLVTSNLKSVLFVAGWPKKKPIDEIENSFTDTVSTIVRLALDINKAIGQDITSVNLHTVLFEPQTTYNPADMEDIFADNISQPTYVVTTTHLGLRLDHDSGTSQVLLKPKVALESAFGNFGG